MSGDYATMRIVHDVTIPWMNIRNWIVKHARSAVLKSIGALGIGQTTKHFRLRSKHFNG